MRARIAIAVTLLAFVVSSSAKADEFSTIRTLYASAAYEEALALLDEVQASEEPALVDQYKALCYIALGRSADAELVLEALVRRQPRLDLGETEVPPRLVELFRAVRNRTLPAVARGLYTRGKASFDAKQFEEAVSVFEELIALSAEPGLLKAEPGVTDLSQLAEGFLTLARAEIDRINLARSVPPAVESGGAAPDVAPGDSPEPSAIHPPVTYTAADEGVSQPVDIARTLPRWVPLNPLLRNATFRGVLEIVIDEQGGVESAQLAEPISPLYDASLLDAAATWRFKPASKEGRPVRFKKRLEIVLQPARR